MRFSEIRGGLSIPTSIEEQKLIDKIKKEGRLEPKKLDTRERELATQLVSRGLLDLKDRDEESFFMLSDSGLTRI